jgi:hypothetical protein
MIQPHELIESQSVLEYYIEETNEWLPTSMDWQDIRNCVEDNIDFNKWHRAIPLTEKILTEWCGFENNKISFGNNEELELDFDGDHYNVFYNQSNTDGTHEKILMYIELQFLHHLQMLVFALGNKPLKIELK